MTTPNTGKLPAILLSTLAAESGREVPLALEGMPTEIEVKVGDAKKMFPVAYFEKDVIECGSYTHPETGQKFTVDQARLEQWASKFNQMRAAGAEIHCPVDHSQKAEDNRGFAIKMRREGNKLRVTQQVIGEDGALMALRNRCSVKINPNYKDEHGKFWGDCVEHVAFTPIPVISGQGPFVPIAASRGEQSTPVFYLSASNTKESDMLDLSKIREAIGAGTTASDEHVIELALIKLGEGKTAATELSKAKEKITELDTKVTTLSRSSEPPKHDPEVMTDRADNYAEKLEILVTKGEMPVSLSKKIKAMFLPEANKPVPFMLSRQSDFGDARPIDRILSLFEGEKLGIKAGEQTVIQLDRSVPGGAPDRQAELLKQQLGTPAK